MNVLLKVNQACRIGGSNSKEEVSCCTLDVFACFELVHPLLCGAVGISGDAVIAGAAGVGLFLVGVAHSCFG